MLQLLKRGSSILPSAVSRLAGSSDEAKDKADGDQDGGRLQRSKTVIVRSNKRNDGKFEMRGWILKKASTTTLGLANWQRRYMYL